MYTLTDFGAMIADHIWLGATEDPSVAAEIAMSTGICARLVCWMGARKACATEPNV
jgi:hypothetical protein